MSEPIRALLFDLDGTIIDTGELHYRATKKALETFGRTIDRAEYDKRIHGNNNADIVKFLFPDAAEGMAHPYVETKETLFREYLKPMPPISGASELIRWAQDRNIPIGLVTNAPRDNKDAMLTAIGMTDTFDTVILGDDLPRGKPDPLPIQTALDALGVAAHQSVGFDDSAHGVSALSAAGVYAIGVTTGLPPLELISCGAELTIENYLDDRLRGLLEDRDPEN